MRHYPLLVAVAFAISHGLAQEWVSLDGPTAPGRGVAYDSRRGRAVMLGIDGETWEYDGANRLHRPTPAALSGRTNTAMVYDAARGHVLLFGGLNRRSAFGDTWLWDGCNWQQPFSTIAPPRRSNAAITFDSRRNRVVMFGGSDPGGALLTDTWEHDGTQWLQRTPLTVPSAAATPALAFDSVRGVSVLVTLTPPVWVFEWNGNDWVARTSTTAPPAHRQSYSIAYDPIRQRTVMSGSDRTSNEIWEWDGSAWQLRAVANFDTRLPGMYFDPTRSAIVIVHSWITYNWPRQLSTWTWNGASLTNVQPAHSALGCLRHALFHDSARNRTVLFGGGRTNASNDTWEWDGMRWIARTPPVRPPAREDAMACFDPVTGTGLLCGGNNGGISFADAWRWDGNTWSQLAGQMPPGRGEGTLTWDPVRNEAILFGGYSSPSWFGDTWRWNGALWAQVATATAPSPHSRHAQAFDPVSGRTVLFGGTANSTAAAFHLNDTWEWDGTRWQRVMTPQSPPPLMDACMVHDPQRGRMLLVGVDGTDPQLELLQDWEYDGSTWTLLRSRASRFWESNRLVWDPLRQRVVRFSTWGVMELTSVPASVDVLGTGCGAPPPLLAARTRPRAGESQFGLELATRPNLGVLFALGFAQGSSPLGNGCTLLVQQVAATSFALADGSGMAVQPIALPASRALHGLVMFAQAGALDAAAPLGVALSHGLRLTVGD